MSSLNMQEVGPEELDDFLRYLDEHLRENGREGPLFMPLSASQLQDGSILRSKFEGNLGKKVGLKGWRKLWLARKDGGRIAGHIDIRGRMEVNAEHRVLLGMGVDKAYRRMNIGQDMLLFVIDYCQKHPDIAWLDLEVLAENIPAKRLYQKLNFQEVGTVEDMFRIGGESYGYTSMTLKVESI
ncbi:MAG: GNAT family N-acetyltransferase [Bacteroidia bacterium]|nr:GNAT family N-acetyltransferase [Bacteroidia bacterium]